MLKKAILNAAYYSGAQAVMRPMFGGIGSILMLHHVRREARTGFSPNYHLTICPEYLESLLVEFSTQYDFISMDEVAWRLENSGKTGNSRPFLAITLDDGFRDNFEFAVPVFRKYGIPYTVFIAPGMVNGDSCVWWEDVEAVVRNAKEISVDMPGLKRQYDTLTDANKGRAYSEIMTHLFAEIAEKDQRQIVSDLCARHGVDDKGHVKQQIADWSELKSAIEDNLCTLGAHTMNHYLLAKLSAPVLRAEIADSKAELEDRIGRPVEHFAYPYGSAKAAGLREFELVKELGFKTAVTTRHGVLYPAHNGHMTALPRISVNGNFQSNHYINVFLSGLPARIINRGAQLDVA